MDINKWTAEKVGITVRGLDARYAIPQHSFIHNGKLFIYEWTMQDARCREIVREHFKIQTKWFYGKERWRAYVIPIVQITEHGEGETIEEAEIACIEAIMKADNG